jgi:hypothetical protein
MPSKIAIKPPVYPHFRLSVSLFFHPSLPGVLRHSVKLRTLPQDTSLRDRVEKSCWTSLAWCRRLYNISCGFLKTCQNWSCNISKTFHYIWSKFLTILLHHVMFISCKLYDCSFTDIPTALKTKHEVKNWNTISQLKFWQIFLITRYKQLIGCAGSSHWFRGDISGGIWREACADKKIGTSSKWPLKTGIPYLT